MVNIVLIKKRRTQLLIMDKYIFKAKNWKQSDQREIDRIPLTVEIIK